MRFPCAYLPTRMLFRNEICTRLDLAYLKVQNRNARKKESHIEKNTRKNGQMLLQNNFISNERVFHAFIMQNVKLTWVNYRPHSIFMI